MLGADFDATRSGFVEKNCAGFEDAEDLLASGAGHPLEWTDVYTKYTDLYEAELTKYCRKFKIKEMQLCADLEAVIETCNVEGVDVLPTFLQTTDYDFFVGHMYEAARVKREEARALARGSTDDPDDLSEK